MNHSFTIKGFWFLPNKSEDKISGILTFTPYDYPSLELIGSFDKPLERMKFRHQPIILGLSTNNEAITLCNCSITSMGNMFSKTSETTYRAHLLITGKHYIAEEEITGMKISVRYDLLEKWVNIFSYKYDLKKDGTFNLESYWQEAFTFRLEDNTIGRFRFIDRHSYFPKNEFSLRQETFFEIESEKNPYTIDDFINKAKHFKTFLMISIGDEISITNLSLFTGEIDSNDIEKEVQVYFAQNRPKDTISSLDHNDFMFTYKDIESGFEKTISKWFENRNQDPLTSLIYLFYQNRKSYAENTLLDAVTGLEIFHRRLRQDTELLKKDFSNRMERICENQIPIDRKFLYEKLQYGYEPSLRKRLKELFSEFDEEFSKVLFKDRKDKLKFIDKVTESRNYYTHYSGTPKKTVSINKELMMLSKKTYLLLILLVLKEIGFSSDQLKEALDRIYYRISYFL